MTEDLFLDLLRPAGDLAGVFEWDGETGYFYLYAQPPKIWGAIHIFSGTVDLEDYEIEILWSADHTKVGLLIRGVLWAVFDADSKKGFGGDYAPAHQPSIPAALQFISN